MSDTAGTNQVPALQIVITMDNSGSIEVNGPLQMEVLCLGMLEKARQTVEAWNLNRQREAARQNASKIEIGRADMLRNINGSKP